MSVLALDFCQPSPNVQLLVGRDMYSGWVDAELISNQNSSAIIDFLEQWLNKQGAPLAIWSDNATSFRSQDVQGYLRAHGIHQIFSPEYHPQSNGQAERAIRSIEEGMRCFLYEKLSTKHALWRALGKLNRTGESPADSALTPWQIRYGYGERTPGLSVYQVAPARNPTRAGFEEGDAVMVRQRGGNKLQPLFSDKGHVIHHLVADNVYQLQNKHGDPESILVHGRDLKKRPHPTLEGDKEHSTSSGN
jgi:hypothetical protein